MSVLDRLATNQGRKDEAPNLELARDLARRSDSGAVSELVQHLGNADKHIQSDCLKVLYEIGSIRPEMIADYTEEFIGLLGSGNNRLVWGAMTALAAVAPLRAHLLSQQFDGIAAAITRGSVITRDQGIRVMAALAASPAPASDQAYDFLIDHLQTCRPKDVPQHSESCLPSATGERIPRFVEVLRRRIQDLSEPQARRTRAVLKVLADRQA